jgi:hypothetical protein
MLGRERKCCERVREEVVLCNALKRGVTGEKRCSGAPIVLCPSIPSSSSSANLRNTL